MPVELRSYKMGEIQERYMRTIILMNQLTEQKQQ